MSPAAPAPGVTPDVSDDELRDALAEANLPTLLAALATMTGDDRWLSDPYLPTAPRDLGDHDSGGLDPAVQQQLRDEAFEVLTSWRDGELEPITEHDPTRLENILATTLAEPIPSGYGSLLADELGLTPRAYRPSSPAPADFRVVIVGAGISGLCLAIRLRQAGIDFVMIDKNDSVGGTWQENTYPGCAVDTPSFLYSLSCDPNPYWSRFFAGRDELVGHWRSLVERHDLEPHLALSTTVTRATWDEASSQWHVDVERVDGTEDRYTGTALVNAVGLLNQPSTPDLPGLDSFDGPVVHTARWDEDVDVTGQRLAVIGTGASAMQLVPATAGVAEKVTVFQRTPQWAMPHPRHRDDVPEAMHVLNAHVPHYLAWYRVRIFWRMGDKVHGLLQVDPSFEPSDRAINRGNDALRRILTAHIERELEGRPDLLAKSLPDYPPYGKRLLIDNQWFRTIRRDDVGLVTEAIETVTPHGVRTLDGVEHRADIIALATGFKAVDVLGSLEIRGRAGRTLREEWGAEDGRAYLGITVPGFPNMFCLYGPNTNTGHGGTVIAGTEMQVQHVTGLLARMVDDDLREVEVRREVYESYNADLDEALSHTIWAHGGTSTYYQNAQGRIVTNSPWQYVDYWRRTHEPDLSDYHVRPAAELAMAGPTITQENA